MFSLVLLSCVVISGCGPSARFKCRGCGHEPAPGTPDYKNAVEQPDEFYDLDTQPECSKCGQYNPWKTLKEIDAELTRVERELGI